MNSGYNKQLSRLVEQIEALDKDILVKLEMLEETTRRLDKATHFIKFLSKPEHCTIVPSHIRNFAEQTMKMLEDGGTL